MEGYYIGFEFDYKGNDYIISIPQRRRLTYENLKYAYYGKFAFIKRDSECCVSVLFTEWTEEKLAEDIEKYFNEKDPRYINKIITSSDNNSMPSSLVFISSDFKDVMKVENGLMKKDNWWLNAARSPKSHR